MTDFDGMVPRHISEDIDVLIINSQSRLLKESHPALEEFTARGGRILKYSYEMDQGSRMLLESTVVASRCAKVVAGAGSVRSSAGT